MAWKDLTLIFFDPDLFANDITVTDATTPTTNLISRHLYPVALCNVEAADNIFVTDHGANPNDNSNDTVAIQAAIEAAKLTSNRVFLPASKAKVNVNGDLPGNGDLQGRYKINASLHLGESTRLCGVARYLSVLDATGWSNLDGNKAVIETVDVANATTVIADFKVRIPKSSGYQPNGDNPTYNPHVFAINWRAGKSSLNRDVWVNRQWGDFGDGRSVVITDNGGGKWFGVTLHGGKPPSNDQYYDGNGNLKMSPHARNLIVTGTTQSLAFYPFHSQHLMQPKGALNEITDASNVTIYGIKSEMGSVPEKMSAVITNPANSSDTIPVWMFIKDSSNISLIGHEGLGQTGAGRGMIEITNSSQVTIASMGARFDGLGHAAKPRNEWYFVKDDRVGGENYITSQGFLSLYKSNLASGNIPE